MKIKANHLFFLPTSSSLHHHRVHQLHGLDQGIHHTAITRNTSSSFLTFDIVKSPSPVDWTKTILITLKNTICTSLNRAEAEFLGIIRTKILRLFLQETWRKHTPLRFHKSIQNNLWGHFVESPNRAKIKTSSLRNFKTMPRNLYKIHSWVRPQET
jgi:hypothetical protein